MAVVTLALPATPLGGLLGFGMLPAAFLLGLAGILVAYVATAEVVKRWFFGRGMPRPGGRESRITRGDSLGTEEVEVGQAFRADRPAPSGSKA